MIPACMKRRANMMAVELGSLLALITILYSLFIHRVSCLLTLRNLVYNTLYSYFPPDWDTRRVFIIFHFYLLSFWGCSQHIIFLIYCGLTGTYRLITLARHNLDFRRIPVFSLSSLIPQYDCRISITWRKTKTFYL